MTLAGIEWCHFDWWFALVTITDFDGDLDALEGELFARLRSLHAVTRSRPSSATYPPCIGTGDQVFTEQVPREAISGSIWASTWESLVLLRSSCGYTWF